MTCTLEPVAQHVLAILQQDGLPLESRPFAALAARLNIRETAILETLQTLQYEGILKRIGLVVRHHELGYRANAMCVFDVPDTRVDAAGEAMAQLDFVTLCYQRRRTPRWPYNLYCMIHGRDRETVLSQLERARVAAGIADVPQRVLFSLRRFKQCGGRYVVAPDTVAVPDHSATTSAGLALDDLDRNIIVHLQDGLPLVPRPYAAVAAVLGCQEAELLARIERLLAAGVLTRFGPMYAADRMGGTLMLAALAVPAERYEEVAAKVNALPEVAHNYAREHKLNMWFVLATESDAELAAAIARIESDTGLKVYTFPKEREYFVGLRVPVLT